MQLEGLFVSSLLLQIQRVNAFSLERAAHIGERLEQLAPQLSKGELTLREKRPPSAPREALNHLVLGLFAGYD